MSAKNGGRKKKAEGISGVISENRRARYDYRQGKANLAHAYVQLDQAEAHLINADIPEYHAGNRFNHKATQPRKLLLHRREISKLAAAVQRAGATVIPLKLYFNDNGIAKLLIGLGTGRKKADKRDNEKRRDWQRDKARLMRERG